MSYSQGNIIFHSNTAASGGGVSGADNGLILLGSIVEMGGPLIKDTSIDKAGFYFDMGYTAGNYTQLLMDDSGTITAHPQSLFTLGGQGLHIFDDGFSIGVGIGDAETYDASNFVQSGFTWTGSVSVGIVNFGLDVNGDVLLFRHAPSNDLSIFSISKTDGSFQAIGGDSFNFRNVVANPVTFDAANYLSVLINGVPYKIALAN